MVTRTLLNALSITILSVIISLEGIRHEDAQKIGKLIWKNESNQRVDQLVFWSEHESFPSLGIGHAIWFPVGVESVFTQEFPQLCTYLQKHGVKLPLWLKKAKKTGAPWRSREEFLRDTKRTTELRQLLATTIEIQTRYMIERLKQQLPLIIEAAPEEQKEKIARNFHLMLATPLGTYALIDYLNFKGSGLNAAEESKGHRWGLLQVLLDMPDDLTKKNVTKAFTLSVIKTLTTLTEKSAPEYSRLKFLNGWIKRALTYDDPLFFKA